MSKGLSINSDQLEAPLPPVAEITPSLLTTNPLPILSNGLFSNVFQLGIDAEVIKPLSLTKSEVALGIVGLF